jgi:hypothetical protein
MIVKNESKIITRLFDSVVPIIDSYCICDTGSSDNTVDLIRTYFKEKKIPGEVFEIPFRDFGYNRTESLKRAEQWGQYALLLDADMMLEISPDFKKADITLDLYQIKQKNACLDYMNTRIVRTDKGIKCVGVTHEYYDAPPGTRSGHLDTLEINDIGDGGAKSDKFERDIRLLRKGLLEDPKNVRYHFYLANSYRDYGTMTNDPKQSKKAIKWYKRRIALGGWDEELFMSCLEIGNIYAKLNKHEKSLYWWLEAYLHRRTRAESLYEIIKYYREKDPRHAFIAGYFYEIAKKIPYPKTDVLFIRKAVYDYLIEYEYSILAYYLGTPIDHYRYLDLLGKNYNYGNTLSNYKFYTKHLSSLTPERKSFNEMTEMTLIEDHTDKFYPSSPSIIPYNDGYMMNQRYVNYFIEPNGAYTCKWPITSFNRRLMLDKQFNVVGKFDFDLLPKEFDKYAGIEDVKIFPHKDKILFFGTEQDLSSKKLRVSGGVYPADDTSHSLVSQIYQSPQNCDCEKNWCYFEHNNGLKIVYKWYPMTIGQMVGDQLLLEKPVHSVPDFFQHLRGSSNGVTCGDEIWFIAHMVEYSSPRNYYHCILIFDRDTLEYKRHSTLFKFEDTSIEYTLGFIVEKNRMIFGFSKMDRETILCAYNRPEIDRFIFS